MWEALGSIPSIKNKNKKLFQKRGESNGRLYEKG
jgi:hypothetical protein